MSIMTRRTERPTSWRLPLLLLATVFVVTVAFTAASIVAGWSA